LFTLLLRAKAARICANDGIFSRQNCVGSLKMCLITPK
jgi:hypothetical protein